MLTMDVILHIGPQTSSPQRSPYQGIKKQHRVTSALITTPEKTAGGEDDTQPDIPFHVPNQKQVFF